MSDETTGQDRGLDDGAWDDPAAPRRHAAPVRPWGVLGPVPPAWAAGAVAYVLLAVGVVVGVLDHQHRTDQALDLAIRRTGAELALTLSRDTRATGPLLSADERGRLARDWTAGIADLTGADRLFVRVSDVKAGPLWEYGRGSAGRDNDDDRARIVTFPVPGRALSVQIGYRAPARLSTGLSITILVLLIFLVPLVAAGLILRPVLRHRRRADRRGSVTEPQPPSGDGDSPALPLADALGRAGCGVSFWRLGDGDIRLSGALVSLARPLDDAGPDFTEIRVPRGAVRDHLIPEDQDIFERIEAAAREGELTFDRDVLVCTPDGRTVPVTVTSLALPDPSPHFAAVWVVRPELKTGAPGGADATTALDRFSALIEGLPDGLALWDPAGAPIAANRRFLQCLALDDAALRAGDRDTLLSGVAELFQRDDGWYRRLTIPLPPHGDLTVLRDVTGEARQLRQIEWLEARAVQREASHTALETRIEAMAADLERAGVTVEALRERVEREAARAKAADHAMTDFLANASHELRTPLNAILGFSEVMTEEMFGPLGNDKYKEYATDIHRSGEAMLGLVTDILDMARLDGPASADLEPARMKIADVVDTCIGLVRARIDAKSLDLDIDLDRLPSAYADAQAVKRILLHLLMNAVKFTPEGGSIRLRGRADLHRITIAVEDTGMGIEAADEERLGTPFVRSRLAQENGIPGLGLGLALSKTLAEASDGSLTLSGRPGEGATALLVLPRRARRITSEPDAGETDDASVRAAS